MEIKQKIIMIWLKLWVIFNVHFVGMYFFSAFEKRRIDCAIKIDCTFSTTQTYKFYICGADYSIMISHDNFHNWLCSISTSMYLYIPRKIWFIARHSFHFTFSFGCWNSIQLFHFSLSFSTQDDCIFLLWPNAECTESEMCRFLSNPVIFCLRVECIWIIY